MTNEHFGWHLKPFSHAADQGTCSQSGKGCCFCIWAGWLAKCDTKAGCCCCQRLLLSRRRETIPSNCCCCCRWFHQLSTISLRGCHMAPLGCAISHQKCISNPVHSLSLILRLLFLLSSSSSFVTSQRYVTAAVAFPPRLGLSFTLIQSHKKPSIGNLWNPGLLGHGKMSKVDQKRADRAGKPQLAKRSGEFFYLLHATYASCCCCEPRAARKRPNEEGWMCPSEPEMPAAFLLLDKVDVNLLP